MAAPIPGRRTATLNAGRATTTPYRARYPKVAPPAPPKPIVRQATFRPEGQDGNRVPLRQRALQNVRRVNRLVDRGGMLPWAGQAIMLPDGTPGGRAREHPPLMTQLNQLLNRVIPRGGTAVQRKKAIAAAQRSSWLGRHIGRFRPRQGPGLSGRHFAVRKRPKPNAPGGVQGAVFDKPVIRARHDLFTRRVTPTFIHTRTITSKMGGSGATMAPVSLPAPLPSPSLQVERTVESSFAGKSPALVSEEQGAKSNIGPGERAERVTLLLAVAVLAGIMLLRPRL